MKKLFAVIFLCLALCSAFVLTVSADSGDFYLGDHPELVNSFSGLEDKLGYNKAHSGDVITIGSVTYDKGFGLHCNPSGTETYIEIDISGQDYDYFVAFVGMQSYSKDSVFLDWGSAKFLVYGDGNLLAYTPDTCKVGDEAVQLSCEIKGVKTLKLVEDCVDGHSCDWGVWGDAMLTNNKPEEQTMPEPEFTPDKTDIVTPAEISDGDYVYASDMYWTNSVSYATNKIMRDANTANEWIFDSALEIWAKGLGMHASSSDYTSFVEINIKDMGFKKFASYYGVCNTVTSNDISMACVKFAVFGDGKTLFESDAKKYGEAFDYMECDISGVSTLKIAIAGAPSISGSWGTWGGAVLIRNGDGKTILADSDEENNPFEDTTTVQETETTQESATTADEAVTNADTTASETVTTAAEAVTTTEETASGETTEKSTGCSGIVGIYALFALAPIAFAVKRGKKHE